MNLTNFKTTILVAGMIILFVMALTTDDVINRKLFASLAIIFGAYSSNNLSNKKVDNYEQN